MLMPVVHLLRWERERIGAVVGWSGAARRGALDLGGVFLLMGAVTTASALEVHPFFTLSGGLGLAVLVVAARSWVSAQERRPV